MLCALWLRSANSIFTTKTKSNLWICFNCLGCAELRFKLLFCQHVYYVRTGQRQALFLSSRLNLRQRCALARRVSARLKKMKKRMMWHEMTWRETKTCRLVLMFFQWAETFIKTRHMASKAAWSKSQSHFFECFLFSWELREWVIDSLCSQA